MCGIAGFFTPSGFNEEQAESITVKMCNSLLHRGPDDAGTWMDASAGIALGHRRLSIIDLSPAGHQPMLSDAGRYAMVYNGEIYNHLEIRKKAESAGHKGWRGHSDTETLLAAIQLWGIENALKESVGMFALALWDRQERTLTLARDRMGEKPLYYGWQNGTLLFGSELKALRAHPSFARQIDRDVLPLYLRYGYIPAPWCVWAGIRKLLPGTWVRFTAAQQRAHLAPTPYWSISETIASGQSKPFEGSDQEAIEALEAQLGIAIAGQRLADVPLGALLSGGIDSSTVVALMQAQSSRPVKTFTIGFNEPGYNEAVHASAVARHLGTEHNELIVTAEQARAVVPLLAKMYDEPFGDSSAIPTHLVSQLARQHVTVSLSGDGGDELFGGYGRYFNHKAEKIWHKTQQIPKFLQKPAGALLRSSGLAFGGNLMQRLSTGGRQHKGQSIAEQFASVANLMQCESHSAFYRAQTSHWNPPPVMNTTGGALTYGFTDEELLHIPEPVQRMMAADSVTYLPDDILTKVDRAAMSVSLEMRVPLLDHRVVELAWRLPYEMKVRNGQGKWLLRQVLYRHVPRQLIERPKMGFGVPVDIWLRGPLREWAEDLLRIDRLKGDGFLNPELIHARWKQHLNGSHNWRDSLWLVLMWQAWLKEIDA